MKKYFALVFVVLLVAAVMFFYVRTAAHNEDLGAESHQTMAMTDESLLSYQQDEDASAHFMHELEEQDTALDVIETIINQKWDMAYLVNDTGEQINLPEQANFMLQFDDQGRVSGRSGCNNFSGGYELLAGDHIQITPNIAMTKMACNPEAMAFESKFLALLPAVNVIRVNEQSVLQLYLDTRLLMALQPQAAEDTEEAQ